jgi:hypothetical protein
MHKVIKLLTIDYPKFNFIESDSYYWSPQKNTIHYGRLTKEPKSLWPLFHEVGHANLGHRRFNSDFELLTLEMDAWDKAKIIASLYGVKIDDDHIQDCLDTYRDWLYRRSTCPFCTNSSLQTKIDTYSCFNCNNTWHVSASRKCRTYRKKSKSPSLKSSL